MTKTVNTKSPGVESFQHLKAAGKATAKQWMSLLPDDFWKYGKEAQREMILAMRSAVDAVIDKIEPEEDTQPTKTSVKVKGKARVEVE